VLGRLAIHHRYLSALFLNNFRFVFSRYTQCVRCGSSAVERGGHLYFLSKNPLGWIQLLAVAPLRECLPCGRQFFNWRPARPLRCDTAFLNKTARDLAALNRAIPPAPSQHGVPKSEPTPKVDAVERHND